MSTVESSENRLKLFADKISKLSAEELKLDLQSSCNGQGSEPISEFLDRNKDWKAGEPLIFKSQ